MGDCDEEPSHPMTSATIKITDDKVTIVTPEFLNWLPFLREGAGEWVDFRYDQVIR